jgi:hypothetical protein
VSDLTDERVAELVTWTSSAGYGGMPDTHRALLELQRLRSAKRADAERVRAVVRATIIARTDLADLTDRQVAAIVDCVTEQLASAAPDAPVRCPIHYGRVHGGEAEELRAGIERLIKDNRRVDVSALQRLLDSVDARDSLAHLERSDGTAVPVLSAEERESLDWLRGHCRTNWAVHEAIVAALVLDRLLEAAP